MAKALIYSSALDDTPNDSDSRDLFNNNNGFSIKELRKLSLTIIDLPPRDVQAIKVFTSIVNFFPPQVPNTSSISGRSRCLWISPNRYLMKSEDPDLFSTLDHKKLIITDITSGRTIFRLLGAESREILAKGCPLDLRNQSLLPGQCAQTVIGSTNVLFDIIDEVTLDILVARGFALHFFHWLEKATKGPS